MATVDSQVRFNNTNNVLIDLPANQWLTFESNISTLIVVTIGEDGVLYSYFEGVLPEEARNPQ